MLKLEKIRAKSLLFLISGILVVGISFIFVNCGEGPKSKALDPNKGAFAVDFSQAPTGENQIGVLYVASSTLPNYTNSELTIETWIKRNTTSTFQGTIFARFDANPNNPKDCDTATPANPELCKGRGVLMYVKDSKPHFAINPSATSTFPVVSDDSAMSNNIWYHIAGVLVNSAHPTHPASTSCTTDVMNQRPHIDIYVNGSFQDCATTNSTFADNPDSSNVLSIGKFDPSSDIDTITSTTRFNGVIDELRFWTVARTESEISQCYNKELAFTPPCNIDPSVLKGYWRLNEGIGSSITDASGNGYSGSKEQGDGTRWDGGWVAGYPF